MVGHKKNFNEEIRCLAIVSHPEADRQTLSKQQTCIIVDKRKRDSQTHLQPSKLINPSRLRICMESALYWRDWILKLKDPLKDPEKENITHLEIFKKCGKDGNKKNNFKKYSIKWKQIFIVGHHRFYKLWNWHGKERCERLGHAVEMAYV